MRLSMSLEEGTGTRREINRIPQVWLNEVRFNGGAPVATSTLQQLDIAVKSVPKTFEPLSVRLNIF